MYDKRLEFIPRVFRTIRKIPPWKFWKSIELIAPNSKVIHDSIIDYRGGFYLRQIALSSDTWCDDARSDR